MQCRSSFIVALAFIALGGCARENVATTDIAADLVLKNARIYTVDQDMPWAEAVAIDDGKIVAVGAADEMSTWTGPETKIVDAGGRLILPSFGDAHVHPVFGGLSYSRCSLHDGKSLEDYQAIIRECIESDPGDGPVYGIGWGDALFPPRGIPQKDVLDEVSTDRALIFESMGGHTYWVNSRALELAGIGKDTPDPSGGKIDRDKNGEPVGGLQESAMALMADFVPAPSQKDMEDSIVYVANLFNKLGITAWHDAGIDLAEDGGSSTLTAYRAVKDRGDLTAHVSIAFKWDNQRGLDQLPAILAATKRAEEWGLNAGIVKFYLDGVIPQRTAVLIEPYAGETDKGPLQIDPDVLEQAVVRLSKAGVRAHFHTIGDGAVRIALDAVAAANAAGSPAQRPMFSHLNVVDPADQPRFGDLGAIAVFQPTWAANYPYMDLTKQALGPVRSKSIYPAGSIAKGGGMIAYGADWPVGTANPLLGLQVGTTRINYEESDSPPLLPGETLSVETAVRAHTENVAYALGFEDVTGSIMTGKNADLVILDTNIFEVPAASIGDASVVLTLFKGEPVFGSFDFAGDAPETSDQP